MMANVREVSMMANVREVSIQRGVHVGEVSMLERCPC